MGKETRMRGINICSNTPGLGGALTNPTVLAKRKGNVQQDYSVTMRGRTFPDAEAAFWALGKDEPFERQERLCAEIVAAKLRQHPRLLRAITAEGGVAWLERCSHYTGAHSPSFQRWEGTGRDSAFLRALIAGYEHARGPA